MYIYRSDSYYIIERINNADIDPNGSALDFCVSMKTINKMASFRRGDIVLSNKEKQEIRKEIKDMQAKAYRDYQEISKTRFCKWEVRDFRW